MVSPARLHAELIGLLRQHSSFCDQRHLVLLAQMVAGLLLSQTVCFDRWKTVLPLGHCLAAGWQRRAQRWLCNTRIDVEALYGPMVLWCSGALGAAALAKARPGLASGAGHHDGQEQLLWTTLEHPSACVSADVVIALLERSSRSA